MSWFTSRSHLGWGINAVASKRVQPFIFRSIFRSDRFKNVSGDALKTSPGSAPSYSGAASIEVENDGRTEDVKLCQVLEGR